MQKNASYFISGSNRAYRSEIALFRNEKLTADDCMVVQAPQGASQLYIVEGRRGSLSVSADLAKAWKTFLRVQAPRTLQSYAVT
jgi:hypothetical protein